MRPPRKACSDTSDETDAPSFTSKAIKKFIRYTWDNEACSKLAVSQLLRHNDGNGEDVIVRAASSGNVQVFEALTSKLDIWKEYRTEENSSRKFPVFEKMLNRYGSERVIRRYLGINAVGMVTNLADVFHILAFDFLDIFNKEQLQNFVEFIQEKSLINPQGIWNKYIDTVKTHEIPVKKFLTVVSPKLGSNEVAKLLTSCGGKRRPVISRLADNWPEEQIEKILSLLENEDQNRVRQLLKTANV